MPHVFRNPQMPEEGIRFPGAKAEGGCEPPNIGARSHTGPLKEQELSQLLSSFSSLLKIKSS